MVLGGIGGRWVSRAPRGVGSGMLTAAQTFRL